jgi:hypothetical protein
MLRGDENLPPEMEPVHIDAQIQEEAEEARRNAVKKAESLRRKRKVPPPASPREGWRYDPKLKCNITEGQYLEIP